MVSWIICIEVLILIEAIIIFQTIYKTQLEGVRILFQFFPLLNILMIGFPETSGQKNKKTRGKKFLPEQKELLDTLSMLRGICVFAKSLGVFHVTLF